MKSFGNLRAISDADLGLMREWRNAPSVRENMYTRHEISEEEHLRWWRSIRDDAAHQYLMYELDGVPNGVVGFNKIDKCDEHAFWAFYASPNAPRGTGMLMELLALDYAFDTLGLHKLSCEVLDFNQSVIKLHNKFGFVEEGVFRSHHKVDGEFVNIHRLGLLRFEWDDSRENVLRRIERLMTRS